MSIIPPLVRSPTPAEIREKARKHNIELSEDEVAEFHDLIADRFGSYERLAELPQPTPEREYTDRDPGYRPDREEDPHNAFVTKCLVRGAETGPLAGYDVGLKDMVSVAGIEMTCGSDLFEGYVPTRDATITTRLLDAGATITAKLNMDALAIGGGTGDQSAFGPVLNPRDPAHLAGGSSSGSAVAVVTGDVDVAIGTDQAGSVRMPAAMSGCVGLKPTFGLVPYTGILSGGYTIDHVGLFTRTVADCGTALEAVAGTDPDDPRQRGVRVGEYADAAADPDPEAVTVGVLEEGFGQAGGDDRVEDAVLDALDRFEDAGADVRRVSVPFHDDAPAVWGAVATGERMALVHGEGVGRQTGGFCDGEFAETFARVRRVDGNRLPINLKFRLVIGQHMLDEYHGRFHAKAQNVRGDLAAAYDDALDDVDVLAMPTAPATAFEREEVTYTEFLNRTRLLPNTAPFNVTGHPAISIPGGSVDDLPVGLMLVGERFDDENVLRAAAAYETAIGWDDLEADS